MLDSPEILETSLQGLGWQAWLARMEELTEEAGHAAPLGPHHAAILVEQKPVLLVTFETHQGITHLDRSAQPLGWSMARALGWSHLCLVADGESWFRDPRVYGYFDRLADDGFFEDFDQVVFYGAGSCGYAAAAFSVAAPGARVLALHPQATLDPRIAEWDHRWRHMRRVAFDDRYGYAPDMLDAAECAVVLYDPRTEEDAMHAALFTRANVTKFRMRDLGPGMEAALLRMNVLPRILAQLSAGRLTRQSLARLYRARRRDRGYQFNLLQRLAATGRHRLVIHLCNAVTAQRRAPRYQKMRAQADAALAEGAPTATESGTTEPGTG